MVSYLNFPIGKKVLRSVSEEEVKRKFQFVEEFKCELNPGEETKRITNSLNRYGQFILVGKDVQSLCYQRSEISEFLKNILFD
mgnify:CR=1 FL=1